MTELLIDRLYGLEALPAVAAELLKRADNRIFLFEAPMGAGKTTLIKELCRQLGSKDHFSSPTFSIVNEYSYPGGRIFHFDLYRLKDETELFDIGIEEYLASGDYCFFEWPAMVESLVHPPYVRVEMQVQDEERHIVARRF